MEYPGGLSEEENRKLKYPFLPFEGYPGVYRSPQGATVLVRHSNQAITLIEQRTIAQITGKSAEKTGENRDDK